MASLESSIDTLYKGLLDDFISARAALARTLAGDEAKRVKALAKPTVVPWAVNQVYWHARSVYDRLRAAGIKLRDAQLAALAGRPADVRRASETHRAELAKVVAEAMRQAGAVNLKPDSDALTQTLEVVSVAPDSAALDGRLTKALRPAGFEALANAVVKPLAHRAAPPDTSSQTTRSQPPTRAAREREQREAERAEEHARQEAVAARRRAAAIDKARVEVEKATKAEERARKVFEQSRQDRQEKERLLAQLEAE